MVAQSMELTRCDAAHPTGDLVADRNGCNQILSGDWSKLRHGQSRGNRRTAHVNDRLVVRVVVFQRLGKRAVRKCRRSYAHTIASAKDTTRAGWRHRHGRSPSRSTEVGIGARERQTNDIHHAELGGLNHVVWKVFEGRLGNPSGQFVRERFAHGRKYTRLLNRAIGLRG